MGNKLSKKKKTKPKEPIKPCYIELLVHEYIANIQQTLNKNLIIPKTVIIICLEYYKSLKKVSINII